MNAPLRAPLSLGLVLSSLGFCARTLRNASQPGAPAGSDADANTQDDDDAKRAIADVVSDTFHLNVEQVDVAY